MKKPKIYSMKALRLFLWFLFFFAALALHSQTILNEEFWVDLEPLAPDADTEYPGETGEILFPGPGSITIDTALERILEEGRHVFSGMIFGYTFSYTPSDRLRHIPEEFSLDPRFLIPRGDPNLFVHQTRRAGKRIYVRLRYTLHDFQEAWYSGTHSNIMGSSTGRGQAPIYAGYREKFTSIQNAVKSAVREYARGRIDNKPRKITGMAFLNGAPRIEISSGTYNSVGSVRLKIDEVQTYGVY